MSDYLDSVLKEYGVGSSKKSEPDYLDSVLSEYGITEKPAPKTRNPAAFLNDTVITGANAALGGVQAVSDFVSPGNKLSQSIEGLIKQGEESQSDIVKAGRAKLGQALESEDVGTQLKGVKDYVLQNPVQAAAMAAGSFALPFGAIKGAKLASGALGLGEKAAARLATGTGMATSGVMAGGDAAGDAYQQVMDSPDLANMPINEREALATSAARKASVVPFVIGGISGAFGADKALATGTRSLLKTGATEFVSEAIEEGSTKLSANIAAENAGVNVGIWKGVAGAAALGGVLGGGTGLAVGALTKQPDSLLPGSTNISTGQQAPDSNAINKAIDANSTEISTNSGQQVIEIQQKQAELQQAQAQADAKAQADQAAAQQAQQKAQEAQQAFIDVASTYGFTPNATGTLSLGKILIRTPEIAQQYITQFEIANKDKSPTQKALFGAALSSGAVPVKAGTTPKAIATSVNTFLNNWQLAGIEDKAEAAEWINAVIPTIEGANAVKEAAPLNEFYKSLTGQDAPAFASLLEQAAEKPTKTKGVKDGQLQLQTDAGLRAVPEQGGATQTSGNQPGDVRPSGVQPIQPGSLGEGSLSLQTGALPSGGISTSPSTGGSGINIPNAGTQAQGQVNASQPKVTVKKRRGGVSEQAVEGSGSVEQTVEDKATGIVETVVRNVIDAVVKRRGRMSNVNLQKLKDFIYYDFSQIENKAAKTGELTKKELAEMFDVSTDTIDGWQDIATNFFEENRGVIQAQLYQTLDASGMSLLELKDQVKAARDFAVGEAVSLEEEERRSEQVTEATRENEEYFEQFGEEQGQTAELGLTEVEDESQLDQRDLQGENTGMSVSTGRTGVSVQEENKPEETINARYIRKAKELEAAENSGDEELVDKLNKELNDLVDEAAGVAKKQVAKSEAIAGEKKKETKNAVQKRSTKGVSVRKQTKASEGIPSEDAEGVKAAAKAKADEESSSLTVTEQAGKAWDAAAKEFPDAPKFAELTEEQQADWTSFGEENWTPEDVQIELIKLAKESATGKAQFSRNEGAGKDETWDVDGLTSFLKQMFVANKNFDNLVSIVANYDELPTYVKNAVKKSEAIQAFVYGKRMYMLANQVQVGQELPVFLHEVGVHLGMEKLLGTANYRKLAGQVMTWANAKNDSQETIIARSAKERVDAAVADAKANGEPLTADEQLDEMLAYFVEEAVALGVNPTAIGKDTSQIAQWFRSLMAALKIALRKVGFDKFDKLSAGNIVDLAFGSAKLEISGAYHGTAAEFRDFKTAHIGTGEGAVAFGWGLYMAERFGIAFDYMTSDVKRKQIRKSGEPDITYKGIGYKDLSGMQTDLFIADRLEYDRRNIASTMIRDLHYDYNNTLTVDSLIAKKIKTYEQGLETAENTLAKQNNKVFKPSEKEINEAEKSKDYYERSLAAIKTINPNDFDFPSKAGFTYKGRSRRDMRRAEMQNIGKNIENKVALDVIRQYEKLKEDFGVPVPVEDVIKLEIEENQKRIDNNELGTRSGLIQKNIDALKALNPKDFKDSTKRPGNLMRVLPMADEGSLMDLDTRLAAQPEILQKIKDGFPEGVHNAIEEKANIELEDLSGRDLQRVMVDLENRGITELYFEMPDSITDSIKQGNFMSEEIVSKYLEYKLGIEGVKYFDASSRSVGGQIYIEKLPELKKIDYPKQDGAKFYPKSAFIRSNDVIIKGRFAGDKIEVVMRLSDLVSNEERMAVIDHIKDEQARQTKNVVMFKDKGVSRVATFPGAKLDSKVKFSLKKARETTAKQLDRLPKPIRTPLQSMMDNIYDFAKKGLPFFAFTEDLADMAAKYVPSAKKYVNLMKERQAIRTKFERNVDLILQKYDALPSEVKGTGEKSVNRFLKDTTMSGKWAYNPGWIKKFDEEKDIDPALKARFDAMPAKAQALIKEVFTHGQNTLLAMQKAVNENINTEYDALIAAANAVNDTKEAAELTKKKAATLTEYNTLMRTNSSKPYAPLKRFGNYVVVGKSQQYIDNEIMASSKTAAPDKIAEARKKLRELEKNEDHYFVQFAETAGEANAIVRDEANNYDYLENFEKDSSQGFGVRDLNDVFNRLRNMVEEGTDSNLSETSQKVLNRLMADLKLTLLSESSARQSERRRKNVAGAEDDMMRAFATQGRATASFIASMENSGDIYDTLRDMKKEADGYDGAGTRAERRRYYNEFMKRHFMGMDYQPSPFVDKALSTTSMWMLLTNPAYYLQNSTQAFMMSLPSMAGKHGYNRSRKELFRAYNDVFNLIRETKGLNEESYAKLPADVRQVVGELVNRGRIDISLEQDLGRWRSTEDSKFAKFSNAMDKLRGVAQDIETVNRVATAIAAYRLEVKRSNPTNATNYADKIIYTTHGDYSVTNAPRITRSGLGRLATQFRKFQLIQLSLMARLFNDAFYGADAETRMIGKKALAFTIGHTAVVGGLMGLPGFAAFAALYGMLFGDEDEPDNPELALRRAIGDETIADLLLKGVPAAGGVDLSGKLGMGNMLSILPYTDVKFTRKDLPAAGFALLTGPFGGLTLKAADAVDYIGRGDYYKGVEQLLPTGLSNSMKGYRYGTEGITSKTGDVTMSPDDISVVDSFMVALGLPTKTITDRQFLQSAKFEYDQFYNEKTNELKREYVRAYSEGDAAARGDVMEEWRKLQESRARNGYTRQPLSTLLKAPQEKAKRERNTVGGVAVNKANRGFVRQTSEL